MNTITLDQATSIIAARAKHLPSTEQVQEAFDKLGQRLLAEHPTLFDGQMDGPVSIQNGYVVEAKTRKLSARVTLTDWPLRREIEDAILAEVVAEFVQEKQLTKNPPVRFYTWKPIVASGIIIDPSNGAPTVNMMTRYGTAPIESNPESVA